VSNLLATIGHYLCPIWHWTLGQLITMVDVLSHAAGNTGSPRSVLIYTAALGLILHFGPKAVRKLRR
jgi:hypothetical protein